MQENYSDDLPIDPDMGDVFTFFHNFDFSDNAIIDFLTETFAYEEGMCDAEKVECAKIADIIGKLTQDQLEEYRRQFIRTITENNTTSYTLSFFFMDKYSNGTVITRDMFIDYLVENCKHPRENVEKFKSYLKPSYGRVVKMPPIKFVDARSFFNK